MMNYKRNHKFIGLSFALALISSLNCQAQLLPTPYAGSQTGRKMVVDGICRGCKAETDLIIALHAHGLNLNISPECIAK